MFDRRSPDPLPLDTPSQLDIALLSLLEKGNVSHVLDTLGIVRQWNAFGNSHPLLEDASIIGLKMCIGWRYPTPALSAFYNPNLPRRVRVQALSTLREILDGWKDDKTSEAMEKFLAGSEKIPLVISLYGMSLFAQLGYGSGIVSVMRAEYAKKCNIPKLRKKGMKHLADMNEVGRIIAIMKEKDFLPIDAFMDGVAFLSKIGWPGVLFGIYRDEDTPLQARQQIPGYLVSAVWVCAGNGEMKALTLLYSEGEAVPEIAREQIGLSLRRAMKIHMVEEGSRLDVSSLFDAKAIISSCECQRRVRSKAPKASPPIPFRKPMKQPGIPERCSRSSPPTVMRIPRTRRPSSPPPALRTHKKIMVR